MARDNEEFTVIFNEHYTGLCRFLECMTGGGRGVAQEIAQESFMRLYSLEPGAAPPAAEARFWLYRVARNLALNELARARTRQGLLARAGELFRRKTAGPEEGVERGERGALLLEMLKALPEHQRAALLLREQEEMSYREIAHVLNVTEGKVKVDIFRARTRLRAMWKESAG